MDADFDRLLTERLVIRRFAAADARAFARYRSLPEVARYQSWEAPYSIERARAFVDWMAAHHPDEPGEWYQLAVATRDDPTRLIGDCAFMARASEPVIADIGYTFDPAYQGRGYATEAVGELVRYLFEDRGKHKVTRRLRHAQRRLVAPPRASRLHARGRVPRGVPGRRRLGRRVRVRTARRRVARTVYSERLDLKGPGDAMSRIVVISFDTEDQARQALASLRGVEKQGGIHFEDTAVVTHKADGSFDVKNEASSATEAGAVVGGLIGGLVFFVFPVAGIAIGAAAGAGIGAADGPGRPRRLRQGGRGEAGPPASPRCSSRSRSANADMAIAALRKYHGEVIQTSLDEETEEALKAALASPAS